MAARLPWDVGEDFSLTNFPAAKCVRGCKTVAIYEGMANDVAEIWKVVTSVVRDGWIGDRQQTQAEASTASPVTPRVMRTSIALVVVLGREWTGATWDGESEHNASQGVIHTAQVLCISGRNMDKEMYMHDNTADDFQRASQRSTMSPHRGCDCRDWLVFHTNQFGFWLSTCFPNTVTPPSRSGRPPRMRCSDWVPDESLFREACTTSTPLLKPKVRGIIPPPFSTSTLGDECPATVPLPFGARCSPKAEVSTSETGNASINSH